MKMVGHHVQVPSGLTVDIVQTNVTGHTFASEEEVNLENLYPALVQCFGIIFLGFIAGKFSFISDVEAKGLGTFVGSFSLPALIFVSLCQLDFHSVNWVFLSAITLAKSLIFLVVLLVGLFIHKPVDPARAALFAIFCTQSNDFALGYPVLNAIYGSQHPQYPMYLYLLAPVSLAFLNPIGFVMMEIGKSRESSAVMPRSKIAMKAFQGIIKNPIIMMTFLGIIGNLLFHGSMPDIIHNFMQTLGSAFSASALFMLGLRMVGQKSADSKIKTSLITPFVLVTMKSLVMPIIAREIVSQLGAGKDANETLDLSNYAFLYGTIPTAPSVFVYASNYGVVPDMIASTITASTFIAAPLMFVTAKLLTLMNMNPGDYIEQLDIFLLDVSIVGLLAAIWVAFVLIMTGKGRTFPHTMTLVLAISQGIACLGAVLWSVLDCRHGWALYLQFIVFGFGVFSTRITTALLAVTLLLLQTKGVCLTLKYRHFLLGIPIGVPAILVASLTLNVALETPAHGPKTDPNFQYGTTQAVVALCVLILSLSATVMAMILRQRYQPKTGDVLENQESRPEDASRRESVTQITEEEAIQESSVEIEDLLLPQSNGRSCGGQGRYRCNSEHRQYCSGLIQRYEVPPAEDALSPTSLINSNPDSEDPQVFRHTLLLLLLCISMFVGAALCIWTLVMDQFSGIYLELVFFDGFLNLGQSIFTFALFGVNAKGIIVQLCYYSRKLLYGREQIVLPPWEDLDQTTRAVCTMFIKHHLTVCMDQVLHDITLNMRVWTGVMTGGELITWLLERGLVLSRQDGEVFGRHLLRGRVIRHVDNHLDFYDENYMYTFQPTEAQTSL